MYHRATIGDTYRLAQFVDPPRLTGAGQYNILLLRIDENILHPLQSTQISNRLRQLLLLICRSQQRFLQFAERDFPQLHAYRQVIRNIGLKLLTRAGQLLTQLRSDVLDHTLTINTNATHILKSTTKPAKALGRHRVCIEHRPEQQQTQAAQATNKCRLQNGL